MTEVQWRVTAWLCQAVERSLCFVFGHPITYAGTIRWCHRCGRPV